MAESSKPQKKSPVTPLPEKKPFVPPKPFVHNNLSFNNKSGFGGKSGGNKPAILKHSRSR